MSAILYGTFERCSSLYKIDFPKHALTINQGAFDYCDNLGYIHFKGTYDEKESYLTVSDYTLNENTKWYYDYESKNSNFKIRFTRCDNHPQHGTAALIGCVNTSNFNDEVTLPSTASYNGYAYKVISIDPGAIRWWSYVKKITIPSSINWMGNENFWQCFDLETVIMMTGTVNDTGVTYIGNNCFYHCRNLNSITFSENLSHIGDGFCKGASKVITIQIPSLVTYIGTNFFNDQ